MVRTETLKNQLKPDWGAFILGWVRQSPATNPVSPNCRSLISPFYLPRTKVSVLGYMSFSKLAYCCKIWYLSSASVLYRNLQNRKDFIEVAKRAVFEIQKSSHLQPLAATCSHSSGCKWPQLAGCSTGRIWNFQSSVTCIICIICSHLQPLAATCSHSSGRKWPQVAASGRKWPLGQVAASGRKWPQAAACGRTWPVALLVGFEISRAASLAATCSHLQPLAATRVAASGRKWPQVAASGRWGKWPQVAASGRKRPHVAARGRLLYW